MKHRLGHLLCIAVVVVAGASSTSEARRQLSKQQLRQLIEQLREGPTGVRNRAAQRLYLLQDARANQQLLKLAADENNSPQTRALFVWALSVVRPPGTAAALRKRLHDDDAMVQQAAATAVGALRLPDGPRLLRRLVSDKSPLVKAAVMSALLRFGDRALPALRAALRSGDLGSALLAIKALGELASPRADSDLSRVARRGRPQLRLQAASQLVRRGRGKQTAARTLCELLSSGRRKGIRLQAANTLGDDRSARGLACLRKALGSSDAQIRRAARASLRRRARQPRAPN